LLGGTTEVKVEPVRTGFLGHIGHRIDAKQPDRLDPDPDLLPYFASQRGLHDIVAGDIRAWDAGIAGDGF
jgi:hypothetical protein